MKRASIILGAASLFFVASIQAGIDDDLIGYYPYDGDANDLSGYSFHGTVYGATLTSDRFGNPDSAYHFDGNYDYITAPLTILGPTDPRTIAGWFKFDSTSIEQHFFETNGVGGAMGVYIPGGPFVNYLNSITQDTPDECCAQGTRPLVPFTDTTNWNHIALTWEGFTTTLYLNGAVVASKVSESSSTLYPFQNAQYPSPDDMLVIGVRPTDFGGYFFRGDADDIRVYNRALSNAEIIELTTPAPKIVCDGFFPPLNNGPVKVKKNRALPFKADLFDSDEIIVTDTDLAALPVIQVLFDSGDGGDAIDVSDEVLSVGQGTDGNEFVFTDDMQWQFNLKTNNYTAPGTYTVSIVSGDDSEYVIEPTCTAQFVIK